MAFVLQSAACVAVGRFNPAILMPEWIVKQGILPEGEAEATSAMGSSLTAFSMHGLRWHANLARLEVFADKEGADPGGFVARILERLEHTPLRAVGSNFHFAVTLPANGELLYRLAEFDLTKSLQSDAKVFLEGTSLAVFSFEDAVLRLSLVFEKTTVHTVTFNFNRDSLSAKDGATAAHRWNNDKEEAQAILRKLAGGE